MEREPLSVDAMAIWKNMQQHEQELWHKRKFLMGLSEMDYNDQNVSSHAGKQLVLPESFLRKDDVFYEDVKIFVERGRLQTSDTEEWQSIIDEEEFCEAHNMSRIILTMLDDLSNSGLCHLAKIVTRGSAVFNKTRPQMERVIKYSLEELHSNRLDSCNQVQMQNQLSQLLKNPKNFRQNRRRHIKLTRKSLISTFEKVQLQNIPVRILSAMYRRLKGTKGIMPQLRPRWSGWNRKSLIKQMEKLWRRMIDQLDEADKLQDPLVKAMAVPGLYSRIASDYQDFSMVKFIHVPPEMEALQNEIVKAICSLDKRYKKEELKKLQLLLDPESNVDVNGLRKAIRNMLIDCLFECSDMEAVPNSLLDALSLINKKSCNTRRFSSKVVIEDEVECILNVGAHIKQLLWNCAPVDRLDQDFADAYMEELEESDDGDIFDDDDQQLHPNSLDEIQIRFNDFSEEVASTGDAYHCTFSSATSTYKDNSASRSCFKAESFTVKDECWDQTEINEGEMHSNAGGDVVSPLVSPILHGKSNITGKKDPPHYASVDTVNLAGKCSKKNSVPKDQRNRYVAIQEVCDQASLVAYQLIGRILADFGQMEALGLSWEDETYLRGEYTMSKKSQVAGSNDQDGSSSIIVQAVREVIPSFPNSQLETVKKFMSS
ncbi:uncharacterized protein LOC110727142 isoform X1 [Chenopodium quinoa]|uniref:Uncharacterized protein n=1 Tax=Chenopodium quinoa TaxID=63459 RepID=A0A803L247_CHEQI|nr:uncharacterized protein LOC110727142 isoform X1 [Chenopodium quinoa]